MGGMTVTVGGELGDGGGGQETEYGRLSVTDGTEPDQDAPVFSSAPPPLPFPAVPRIVTAVFGILADVRDILDTPAQPRAPTSALVVSLHRQPASTNTRTPPNSNTPVIGIFHASFMLFAPP